jgi:RNA polymerase sigma-70 factor (ECF subfamily)
MTNGTDRELVDRFRGGDMAAFEELIARHQHRIHGLATHLLHDRTEAEDVTQETFIRAFGALDRFDGRSEPYTWLYRIAVNLSLNVLRSRKVHGATSDVDDPRFDGLVATEGSSDGGGETTSARQLYEALAAGIDALSESLRTTLILVCIDGRTHEEASAILGAPEGTIAWRVHEARRKLREYMIGRGFGPEET